MRTLAGVTPRSSAAWSQVEPGGDEGVEVGLGQGYVAHGTQFSTHRRPEPIHARPAHAAPTRPARPRLVWTGSSCVPSNARRDAFPSDSRESGRRGEDEETHRATTPDRPPDRQRRRDRPSSACRSAWRWPPSAPAAADHERLPQGRHLKTYTVKPGDTATGLAVRFHAWTAELISHNHLDSSGTPARRAADRDPGGHRGPGQGPRQGQGQGQRTRTRAATRATRAARSTAPAAPRPASPSRDRVRRTITRAANHRGVDPQLALAVAWQESGWQMHHVSSAGAIGAMQVLPGTGRWMEYYAGRDLRLRVLKDNATAGVLLLGVLDDHTRNAPPPGRRLLPGPRRPAGARPVRRDQGVRRQRAGHQGAPRGRPPAGLSGVREQARTAAPRRDGPRGPRRARRFVRWGHRILPRPAMEVELWSHATSRPGPPAARRAVPQTRRSAADALVGRLLDGRYRIGGRIARGGMASVYEATDIRLDRTVAVKVMHPGLGDDDDFAQRFVREARAAARLNHPHVVGVYDQGDDDGTVFLAMEYVPGHTLRDVIRKESPMAPLRALALLEPVVSALAAAHRAGLIHRDVKPENVLIADEAHGGGVKVADFGLAKAVSADTQHTATGGVLIGTVSYLAPELVVDGRADARADVYAAGVVLYELLTGRKPHEGESPIQVAYRHVHEDVPAPSALQPGPPAVRRRPRRARHQPRPHPAPRRRRRAAAPDPPGLPGPARGRHRRPRADRRPRARGAVRRRRAIDASTTRTPRPSRSTRSRWPTSAPGSSPRPGTRGPRSSTTATTRPRSTARPSPPPRPAPPAGRGSARRTPPQRARARGHHGAQAVRQGTPRAAAHRAARRRPRRRAPGGWAGSATPSPRGCSASTRRRPRPSSTRPAWTPRRATRATPRPSPRGWCWAPTRSPATGCSTAAPSRWSCRWVPSATRCRRWPG